METFQLLENPQFLDDNPNAEPLFFDKDSRVLRFALRPGQVVREHEAPNSPVHIVVLQGQGYFAGPDGEEKEFGPNALLVFGPGEKHSIRATDEELIFVAFLHGAPGAQS